MSVLPLSWLPLSWPPLSWLALGAAALLLPVPATAPTRVRALAGQASRARRRPAGRLPGASVLCALVGAGSVVGATLAWGAVLGVAAAALALVGSRVVADAGARRRALRAQRDLLAAVRLLVAEVESGSRPEAALAAAADVVPVHAPALRAAAHAAGAGQDAGRELLEDPALGMLGHAWQVVTVAGVPLVDVLSGVTVDLAARLEQARTVTVALSGARSTAALLAGLPLIGVGLGAAMGARPLAFLLHDHAGKLVCGAGVVLDGLGLLWTQRLARRAELA